MGRTLDERVRDVRRLVDAGRALGSDDRLVDALVETTGLSRPGVVLAVEEHLETAPSDEDLRRLVQGTGTARTVHVILSANVFVAALRAIAVARAAASRVVVVPSSREPVFARALVERAADPGIMIDDAFRVESLAGTAAAGDEIHVYGRDETIVDVRARAPEGVRVRGHGAGLGLACVTGASELGTAARAIARDVVAFDQRGCLSPRVVLFIGGLSAAEGLCGELDGALASFEERVPRGRLETEEWSAAARYLSTIAYAGRVWRGSAHVVGLAPRGAPLWIPPAGRHLHVAVAASLEEARELVANVAHFVTAVGSDSGVPSKSLVDHPVRISALGQMQRPPLDGPVDLRG